MANGTRSLEISGYTIDNFAEQTQHHYILPGNQIPGITQLTFANMFGFTDILPKSADDFKNTTRTRAVVFSNFWSSTSKKNVSDDSNLNPVHNFSTLGLRMAQYFDMLATSKESYPNQNKGNILVTYIMVFALTANLSPNGNALVGKPIDFFDSNSMSQFSDIINNCRLFLNGCRGLGNINIGKDYNTMKPLSDNMNNGFIKRYCQHLQDIFCESNGFEDEICIAEYRQEISNNISLVSLCGCFAPLQKFMEEDFDKANISPLNKCDYFCYQTNSYKLYKKPGEGGEDLCTESTICVLDLTNININNTTGGEILFEQLCKCPAGTLCQCFLEVSEQGKGLLDNVRDGNGKGLLNNINFRQKCSTTSCYLMDLDGKYVPSDCNPVNIPETSEVYDLNDNGLSGIEKYKKVDETFWIIVIILTVAILIYIITFLEISFSK